MECPTPIGASVLLGPHVATGPQNRIHRGSVRGAEMKIGEMYLARIVVKADATDAAQAIVFPTDAKAM